MSVIPQSFGSQHTEIKLKTVETYLDCFVTALKKQKFKTIYVDAFAGSGASAPKSKLDSSNQLTFEVDDVTSIIDGSAKRALQVDPPFSQYIFIEMMAKNVRSLQELVEEFPDRKNSVKIIQGDANATLLEFAAYLNHQNARAVVFLDPFGLSLRWEVTAALAATKKVDLWYLVPVLAMSRQVKGDGTILDPGGQRIDEIWGNSEWRQLAVAQVETSGDLFGEIDPALKKIAKAKQFSDAFRERLQSVYEGGVAKNVLPLGARGVHEFSLMFACANPAASDIALRLANAVLKR